MFLKLKTILSLHHQHQLRKKEDKICTMPKRKAAKGTKVTLKTAKKAITMTPEGRQRLTLSNMGIVIFPKCILKLTSVDELDLSRNKIQKLPDHIGNFLSLKWLDLHSNKLESVPDSIGNLVGLTHLNLSNNHLTSAGLPSTIGLLTSLKSLNLGMNHLDTLPPTMVALDSLQELVSVYTWLSPSVGPSAALWDTASKNHMGPQHTRRLLTIYTNQITPTSRQGVSQLVEEEAMPGHY
ncbi:leucine-rich repeat-containing protein 18 isoform X2 [Channa argus]|uniref:leucine-rich repeat-containing protein 18 isoform X2 n=1 Tax=Channa argus TaxID=215402 RepID=UPI00352250C9